MRVTKTTSVPMMSDSSSEPPREREMKKVMQPLLMPPPIFQVLRHPFIRSSGLFTCSNHVRSNGYMRLPQG